MTRAKTRVPRSRLYRDLRDEANVLTKKLRPMLEGFRLGAVTMALAALESENMEKLLAAEALGCDCISEPKHGLYKCKSRRAHAVTTLAEIERAAQAAIPAEDWDEETSPEGMAS
jgi:hypothetical protein